MTEIIPVVLALFGVVALMLGVLFLMKWLNTRITGRKNGNGIRISSCVGVGQDKSVMAVKAGSKNLLIGVTQGSITLICELSNEDMALIEGAPSADGDMAGRSFAECMKYNAAKLGRDFITPKPHKDDNDDNGNS
ncbi:MAG: flagellar biosynthetic protein FliO [Oscillospiraceae bacterium]|nr:flagellar biosynthetic protein FliO [Oscillospiraceae bacterium]